MFKSLFKLIILSVFLYPGTAVATPEKAEKEFEKAVKAFQENNIEKGLEHLENALSLDPLNSHYPRTVGSAHLQMGSYAIAIESFNNAFKIDAIRLGADNINIAGEKNWFAQQLISGGAFREAIPILKNAIEDYALNPNINNDLFVPLHMNLAFAHSEAGDYDQAVSMFNEALNIALPVFGESHDLVASIYNGMALSKKLKGSLDLALIDYYKAEEIMSNVHGNNHPEVAVIWNNIGNLLGAMNRHDEGMDYHNKALQNAYDNLGAEHPFTAARHGNIGMSYMEQGKVSEAIDHLVKSTNLIVKNYGEDHPATATAWNNLGKAYVALKDYKQGIDYLEKSYEILLRTRGPNHIYTIGTKQSLDDAVERQRNDKLLDGEQSPLQ